MTSESLRSIYQQYKDDTNDVASWLATTAKAFGYSGKFGAFATTKPSARLKGKERKQAKAAQVPNTVPSEPSKPKYILAIADFVPLAEHIVNVTDSAGIKLPSYFSVALERAIWVRKSFSEKLADAGRRSDQKSDTSHSYFVSVLEKVRKVLQPLKNEGAFNVSALKDTISKAGTHKDGKGISSLFEILDVYEPSAAFEAAPDVVLPSRNEPEYTVEVEKNSLFEAIFAMTTLMDDLSRMRTEIAKLWTRYEAGGMDIAAVSVATNTAIELARSFEEEVKPLVQENGGSSEFHVNYFHAVSAALGVDAEAKQRPTDDYNFAAYDTADALLINPLILIIAHVRANPLGKIASYNGLYGWYNENSRTTSGSGRQKYARIKSALLEMLSDLPLTANLPSPSPVEDQLTYGMMMTLKTAKRERKQTPDVPIWFSFAAQVYLDVLSIVKVGKGWTDMQRVMRNVKQSVHNLPNSCPEQRNILKHLEVWDSGMDPIALLRSAMGRPYKEYTSALWTMGSVHEDSIPPTRSSENSLNLAWKDLETLRKMQGDSTFFIGEPPSSFEGYFNNFCLTLGSSVTNWAPNKRDKKLKVNKENKPLMKFMGMTSTLATNRIGPSLYDRQPVSTDVVEGWIQKSNKSQTHAKTKDVESSAVKTRQPLLYRLAATIAAEIPDLEFDYFAIHNLCRELLLRLQTAEEKVTGPEFTKGYMSHGEHNVAIVVGFVFSTLAGRRDIDTTTVSTTRLLEVAAEMVQQWLSEGKGSLVTGADDVLEESSGHRHTSSASVSSASSSSSWRTESSDVGVWSMD